MNRHETSEGVRAFRNTFHQVHAAAMRLAEGSVRPADRHLRQLCRYALRYQRGSQYPFLFKYAFARAERDGRRLLRAAAAVHLLQTSTLIIDDVFDGSELRYGRPTVHRRYKAHYAIMLGELFQTLAMETLAADLQRFPNAAEALKVLNRVPRETYLSQYLDMHTSGSLDVTPADYERMIALGPGNFHAALAKCGALLAAKPAAEVRALERFGFHYGMAQFITDDLADFIRPFGKTGKDYAPDLRNRRMKLPVILALRAAERKEVLLLKDFLAGSDSSPDALRRVAGVIQRCGGARLATLEAQRHLARALSSLGDAKKSLTAKRLRWLAEILIPAQGIGA